MPGHVRNTLVQFFQLWAVNLGDKMILDAINVSTFAVFAMVIYISVSNGYIENILTTTWCRQLEVQMVMALKIQWDFRLKAFQHLYFTLITPFTSLQVQDVLAYFEVSVAHAL